MLESQNSQVFQRYRTMNMIPITYSRALALSCLVVLVEICIYLLSDQFIENTFDVYQISARYSARVSYLLFIGILLWTGVSGLRQIYSSENKRQWFVALIFALFFNHLIHFYFLANNLRLKGIALFHFGNTPGIIAYLILTLSPFFLWSKRDLTSSLYKKILFGLMMVMALFLGTYIKRLSQQMDIPISKLLIVSNLTILLFLLVINVFRVFVESKKST